MNTVEINAAELLLDKGVRVELRAPFFMRWICKNIGVTVRRPVLGTMMRISRLYLKLGIDISKVDAGDMHEAHRLLTEHGDTICRIVATGMIRGRLSGWMFARPLGWYLRWHSDALKLAKLSVLLIELSGVQHFTNTIRFLAAMRMTAPKTMTAPKLSPQEKGSQQAK